MRHMKQARRVDNGELVQGYYCKKKCGSYVTGEFREFYSDAIITMFSDGGIEFVEVDLATVEDVAVRPIKEDEDSDQLHCPNCMAYLDNEYCEHCDKHIEFKTNYCSNCGQRLDWSSEDGWSGGMVLMTDVNGTNMKRLKEIEERLRKATSSPWHIKTGFIPKVYNNDKLEICEFQTVYSPHWRDDIELIAHSPSDIQYLLEQLEAAITQIETLESIREIVMKKMTDIAFGEDDTCEKYCSDCPHRICGRKLEGLE